MAYLEYSDDGLAGSAEWRIAMPLLLAEIDWNALFADPGVVAAVAAWLIVGSVVLGVFIAIQWRKVRQAECDARLKEQMIERGFSADEIVRVVDAGAAHSRARKAPFRADDAADPCCPKPFASC